MVVCEKVIIPCLVIYFTYLIVGANAAVVTNSIKAEQRPTITIRASTSYDYAENRNVNPFKNSTMAVIPTSVRICLLICNASYPVTWIIHDEARGIDVSNLGFRTRRMATNIFDSSTFTYSAELNFYPQYNSPWTGNYTCTSVVKPELASSEYLFWEGTTALLHANKNLTIYTESDDLILTIPCIITQLKVKNPTLQKKNGTIYQNVNMDKNISYVSSKGFLLKNPATRAGQYKCIVDGRKDWLNVEVKVINVTYITNKNSNANFTYDVNTRNLICCTGTKRSPKLVNYYCQHPSICTFKSLITILPSFYSITKKSKRGCSRVKLYSHTPGIAHCLGDGIDMIKQYVFPMRHSRYYWTPSNETIPAYMQWNEIPPQEMLLVTFEYIPQRFPHYYGYKYGDQSNLLPAEEPLYDGQMIKFACEPSPYYFSEGVRWAIKWKNQTLQLVNSNGSSTDGNINYFHGSMSYTTVKLHVDMEAMICIAPVWNSTEYVFKPLPTYVNASTPAVLKGYDQIDQSFIWIMNETNAEIFCKAQGIPMPTFTWTQIVKDDTNNTKKDLSTGGNNANITRVVNNLTHEISETMTINRVSYDTAGVYICTATNSISSVSRKVTVEVDEPLSWKKGVAAVVGITLVVTLVVGLGVIYWKMRVDGKVIKELTTPVGFNNSINREGNFADTDNTRYDTPKIQSNLLN